MQLLLTVPSFLFSNIPSVTSCLKTSPREGLHLKLHTQICLFPSVITATAQVRQLCGHSSGCHAEEVRVLGTRGEIEAQTGGVLVQIGDTGCL